MKRGLLLLVLVLFPLSFALTDKVIYNNWILAGTSFKYENESYEVYYIRETNDTVVYFPDGVSAVLKASYENCTQQWIYTICQTKQKFERAGTEVPPTIRAKEINVSLFLKINKTQVELDFTKNLTPSSLFLTDVIEVKTNVKNNLLVDFENVSFIDSYPEGFVIDSIYNCFRNLNSVIWEGDVKSEKGFLCTYKLRPVKEGVFKNTATLSYSVLGKEKIKTINYTIDVKQGPFTFSTNITNTSFYIEEPFLVNLRLKTLAPFNLKEIKIALPNYYNLLNYSPEFKIADNNLIYTVK